MEKLTQTKWITTISKEAYRWNIELGILNDEVQSVRICTGDHDKNSGCEWKYFEPEEGEEWKG